MGAHRTKALKGHPGEKEPVWGGKGEAGRTARLQWGGVSRQHGAVRDVLRLPQERAGKCPPGFGAEWALRCC